MAYDAVWPVGKPFPLMPLEAWYVMQGWEVALAGGITQGQVLAMPGRIEGGAGWVRLWRS